MPTKLFCILFISVLPFIACKQKSCEINDYLSTDWATIDSTTSYFLCNNSQGPLGKNDSVNIEYIGLYEKDGKVMIQNPEQAIIFTILTAINPGRFSVHDSTLPGSIQFLINRMKKGSNCIVRYDLSRREVPKVERMMSVYFYDYADSNSVADWIRKNTAEPYIDSFHYVTKEEALSKYAECADSTWKSVLGENPLPASLNIYLKEKYFDTAFMEGLKKRYANDAVISDVAYSSLIATDAWRKTLKLMTARYFIKVSI